MTKMQREIIGIDFGTTNSAVAFIEFDEPVIIENDENESVTPSIVYFKEGGDVVVGNVAKQNIIANPELTIKSIKRHMGTDHRIQIGDASYPPEYIGAQIIKKLVQNAEERIGASFTDAVITVPAYFMDPQRQAVKDAAEIAGLNVKAIINEPTAAALAFGFGEDTDQRVLVYDFGGGTFDVSILNIGGGFFDVDATSGDNHLGGDDIDAKIEEFIIDKIKENHNIDLRNQKQKNLSLIQSIREEAERAKIELSVKTQVIINLPFIGTTNRGRQISFSYNFSRQEFNKLISDFILRTKKPIENALDGAALDIEDIDEIIMVGGTTYIPAVREFVREFFGKEPKQNINAMELVALGAAAATLKDTVKEVAGNIHKPMEVSDVTSHSLGVLIANGTVSRIISKNTKIPIVQTEPYTNSWDYTESVEIEVYQGESLMPEEEGFLGNFSIDVEPMPAYESKIDVTFEVGEEFGILNVTAKDQDSGNERKVKMEAIGRLSKKEKNRWMKKLLDMQAIEVNIVNVESKDVLKYYLNPNAYISNIKNELMQKKILAEGFGIFYNDVELDENIQIKNIGIKENSTLEIMQKK